MHAARTRADSLVLASAAGDVPAVKAFLQGRGPQVLQATEITVAPGETRCVTPLVAAALGQDQDSKLIIEMLLAKGALVNQLINGVSALLAASAEGKQSAVEVLLANRADLHQANSNGGTPLIVASARGHADIVEALILHKADPHQANGRGVRPLSYASSFGHGRTMQCLLAAAADPNLATASDGYAPLHYVCKKNEAVGLRLLLTAEADPNQQTVKGKTALFLASSKGHVESVQLLLDNRADPTCLRPGGASALHVASTSGELNVIDFTLFYSTLCRPHSSCGGAPEGRRRSRPSDRCWQNGATYSQLQRLHNNCRSAAGKWC